MDVVETLPAGAVTTVAPVQTEVEALDLDRLIGLWPAVVDQVRESGSEFLSAAFEAARPIAVDAKRATIEIGFPPSAAFNKRKADGKDNRERFSEAVRTVVGARFTPAYVMLDEEPAEAPSGGPAGPAVEAPTDERDLVERFKAEFDAEELIEHPDQAESGTNGETATAEPTNPEEGQS